MNTALVKHNDGESKNELLDLAKSLNISFTELTPPNQSSPLCFTSWIREIDVVMAGLDIVTLCSLNEGTPVSLIEAQSASKPVVSTTVGGIEDIVIEGKSALLCNVDDQANFESHLKTLISDRSKREEMGIAGRAHVVDKYSYTRLVSDMENLYSTLLQENQIQKLATQFIDKDSALFLGRGTMYAIAMEGALKLKEISYIHAEAFPAGELKHGPIALIEDSIPVIAVAPNDELLSKLKSNLQEVKSRGSQMIVFEDKDSKVMPMKGMEIIPITSNIGRITAPLIFTIPLQLLSYHVALIKGTDVDKPRNLAKSVTVE